jgi:hypothetical protein
MSHTKCKNRAVCSICKGKLIGPVGKRICVDCRIKRIEK